ncbi:MAG: thioredoxin family protein [Odoribacteraceae bacterium]|nr:thioredoxin family protein [Odoribacteraceae bacterium]
MCLLTSFQAFSQGVQFRELTLAKALETARSEKKIVFVDCYTTWCGPCKHMAETVFPRKEAGDFFNRHFVSVKFDMEKGEGAEIQKKYNVQAFPTFLMLTPGGEEQYRVVGSGELTEFIPRVKRGMNANNSLAALKKEYASGKMQKQRKLAYLIALQDAFEREESVKVAKELTAQLSTAERLTATYWPLIENSTGAPAIETLSFVAQNLKTAKKNMGEQKVTDFLTRGYTSRLDHYISGGVKNDDGVALIATIRERIASKQITADEVLNIKLEIAAALSNDDPARMLSLMEANTSRLPLSDLFNFMFAFGHLDKGNKALMAQVVNVGKAIIASSPDEADVKAALAEYFGPYEKAASVGVYWEHLSLEEALKAAKKSNKYIFVDCYTTWCGPCKYMADNIFTRADVGEFFNERFINVKFDMESGEGPEMAKRYHVSAYPTFLILHPDGTVRHKIVGGSDEIIQEAREGLDDQHATSILDKKFDDGNRDKEFLTSYLRSLISLNETERAREVNAELNSLLGDAEKTSADYWFLYEDDGFSDAKSESFNYLLAHKKEFDRSIGKEIVDKKITSTYMGKLYSLFLDPGQSSPAELDQMKRKLAPLKLANQNELATCIEIFKGYVAGDAGKMIKACKKGFRYLTDEQVDVGVFALNYLKEKAPGQISTLKALAGTLAKNITDEEYKTFLSGMFDEKQGE